MFVKLLHPTNNFITMILCHDIVSVLHVFLFIAAYSWINRAEYMMFADKLRYNDIPFAVYGQFFLNPNRSLFEHENRYVRINGSERLHFDVTFNTSTDGGIYFYDLEFFLEVGNYPPPEPPNMTGVLPTLNPVDMPNVGKLRFTNETLYNLKKLIEERDAKHKRIIQ